MFHTWCIKLNCNTGRICRSSFSVNTHTISYSNAPTSLYVYARHKHCTPLLFLEKIIFLWVQCLCKRENLEVFLFISSRASPRVSRDQDELSYSLSHSYQVYHIWELENWDESKAAGRSYAWLLRAACMQYVFELTEIQVSLYKIHWTLVRSGGELISESEQFEQNDCQF